MNDRQPRTSVIICLLSVLTVSICDTGRGNILNWTNTAGGDWGVAANWEPNQAPQTGDIAIITNSGNYIVTIGSYAQLDSIVLGDGTGGQTLAVSGNQLVCSGS